MWMGKRWTGEGALARGRGRFLLQRNTRKVIASSTENPPKPPPTIAAIGELGDVADPVTRAASVPEPPEPPGVGVVVFAADVLVYCTTSVPLDSPFLFKLLLSTAWSLMLVCCPTGIRTKVCT